MKKSILVGVSIVTVLAILLAAVALGFGDKDKKFNAFTEAQGYENDTEKTPEVQVNNEISEISMEGAIQQAQSNVSFRILKPMYIPSGYKFDIVTGTGFKGAMNDIDIASFSYKNEDKQFTIKEIIMVARTNITPSDILPEDTREIVSINGIEGRYSLENGIKLLSWKIGNLSLSIRSWKNEGQNQTESSLSKEEMINIAESVREKTPDEAIAEAQEKISFKILQPSYIPAGYRMNTWQTSGTKFRGTSLEAEQVMIPYIKGDEFFEKNQILDLKEILIIKDDTDVSESVSGTPYKLIDINGTQGRFLEEASGTKSLNWKKGNISLTISSYAYKENNVTGTSITLEEMAKMARSVK